MNQSYPMILAVLLATMLAGPASAGSVSAQAVLGCTTCVYIQPSPVVTQLGDYTAVQVTVQNPLSSGFEGLVYGVVHDSRGLTVANSSGVLDLGPDSSGNATILIFGLTSGTDYAMSLYAIDTNGASDSPTEAVDLTPSQSTSPPTLSVPLGTDTFGIKLAESCPIIVIPCETYVNNYNSTIYGVAYFVLHNSLAQTVDISTALIVLSPGQYRTVSMPVLRANGTALEFVVSVDQFGISPLATVSLRQ